MSTVEESKPKAGKRHVKRSPNYPMFGLQEAIERAELLHAANDEHFVSMAAAAQQLGYSPTSSSLVKAVGALNQYGLIEDRGSGDVRQVKVSDRFLDIHMYPDGSEKKSKALKDAALDPNLHKELWEKYEHKLPPKDEGIRLYLLREREDGVFNKAHVDGFIERFRRTLTYARLDGDQKGRDAPSPDTSKNGSDPKALNDEVRVGSFVQWTSQGADQFPEPLKVAQIVDGPDGKKYAYVEGEYESALPMDQLTVENPPQAESTSKLPPNPFFKRRQPTPLADEPQEGFASERKKLDEGHAEIRWPDEISADSYYELEHWLQGVLNRARRKAGIPAEKK